MAWMARTRAWIARNLSGHSQEIMAVCSALGVLVGVFGFGFAYFQISQAQRAIEASNAYQLQKDARDLLSGLAGDDKLGLFLQESDPKSLDPAVSKSLWLAFNFYMAVYRQYENGGLSDGFVDSFREDFCLFVANKNVDRAWNEMRNRLQVSDQQQAMRDDWCKKPS